MSQVTIRIPTPLRGLTGGADEVCVEADDVGMALKALSDKHDGIQDRVFDASGTLRPFVNVFLGSDDVKHLQGLETPLNGGEVLSIIPAVAGGRFTP